MADLANQIQLKKGALELCVLSLLARRESYAYEIASPLAAGVGMGEGTMHTVAGVALLAAGIGIGALLLFGMNAGVRKLGAYARRHDRLFKPEQQTS